MSRKLASSGATVGPGSLSWPVHADQGPPRGPGIPAGCVAPPSNNPPYSRTSRLGRPRQYSMQPDAYHCPLRFRTIQSVYCRLPSPNGVSGQLPGPFCLVCSIWTPLEPMSSRVNVAVAGQLATSPGEFRIVARCRLSESPGAGPPPPPPRGGGPEGGGGGGGTGVSNSWDARPGPVGVVS